METTEFTFSFDTIDRQFDGIPLESHNFGGNIGTIGTGSADTVIYRGDAIFDLFNGTYRGYMVIVAASFRSVEPFDIGGGPEYVRADIRENFGEYFPGDRFTNLDASLDLVITFEGEESAIVSFGILSADTMSNSWGRMPPVPNAVKFPGMNFLLNGNNTADDCWLQLEHSFGFLLIGGIESGSWGMRNATLVFGDVNHDGVLDLRPD